MILKTLSSFHCNIAMPATNKIPYLLMLILQLSVQESNLFTFASRGLQKPTRGDDYGSGNHSRHYVVTMRQCCTVRLNHSLWHSCTSASTLDWRASTETCKTLQEPRQSNSGPIFSAPFLRMGREWKAPSVVGWRESGRPNHHRLG